MDLKRTQGMKFIDVFSRKKEREAILSSGDQSLRGRTFCIVGSPYLYLIFILYLIFTLPYLYLISTLYLPYLYHIFTLYLPYLYRNLYLIVTIFYLIFTVSLLYLYFICTLSLPYLTLYVPYHYLIFTLYFLGITLCYLTCQTMFYLSSAVVSSSVAASD